MTNCNEEPKILLDWKKVFVSREEFLKLVGFAGSGIIGLVAVIPALGFVFNYLWQSPRRQWVNIGPVDKFQEGQTQQVVFESPEALPWDGVTAHRAAWVRRMPDNQFLAFAINCTHLGCPVRWEAGASLFFCPCHGGVFYQDGGVAAGPPPRPMHRYAVRVNGDQVQMFVGPVLTETKT